MSGGSSLSKPRETSVEEKSHSPNSSPRTLNYKKWQEEYKERERKKRTEDDEEAARKL
jgi:hypothetical protein